MYEGQKSACAADKFGVGNDAAAVGSRQAAEPVSYTHLDVYKRQPHRVCGNCGYYNGREVVKKEA